MHTTELQRISSGVSSFQGPVPPGAQSHLLAGLLPLSLLADERKANMYTLTCMWAALPRFARLALRVAPLVVLGAGMMRMSGCCGGCSWRQQQ